MKQELIGEIKSLAAFFERSTSCLEEKDSGFTPTPGMMSVAQQVAHTAQTITWFIDGMQSPQGFDLNFEKHITEIKKTKSLQEARQRFSSAVESAIGAVGQMSEAALKELLPAGPVMGGQPKFTVIGAMADHTAHHRGALTVYSRLLGKEPKMPYG